MQITMTIAYVITKLTPLHITQFKSLQIYSKLRLSNETIIFFRTLLILI